MANSTRMTNGQDLGLNPHTGVQPFSMRKIGIVLLSKILLKRQRMGHSR